jgi:TonB family protein
MKKTLIIAFCVAGSLAAKAQSTDSVKLEAKVQPDQANFISVEQQPEFPGGNDKFLGFIARTVRYPMNSFKAGIEGKVYVQIMIEADGTVTNPKIIRSVSKELDDEAIRVVSSSPRWKPGIQNGQPAKCPFIVPISFNIGKVNATH